MARVVLKNGMEIRGMIGDLVYRNINGVTLVSARPHYNTEKQTARQKQTRDKFRKVAAEVKRKLLDPEVKAHYQREAERVKLPNAYTAALKEGMSGG